MRLLSPDTLEHRLGRTRTLLLAAFVAFLLLNLVAYPIPLESALSGDPDHPALQGGRYRNSFIPLTLDPFGAQTPNAPQFRLRLLPPLTVWALHIPAPYSALIFPLSTLPALFALGLVLRQHLPVRHAILALLGLTLTTPFFVSNCWIAYPDSLAAGFVFLCMATRSPGAVLPLMFLAMLTDERSITSLGLVACFHYYCLSQEPEKFPLAAARRQAILFFGVGSLAFVLWAVYAYLLLSHLKLTWTDISAPAWTKPAFVIPRATYHFFFAFRAVWLFPAVALPLMLASKAHRSLAIAAILFSVPIFASSFTVDDTNRVVCQTFPLVILSILYLHHHRPTWLPSILYQTLAFDLLCPVILGFFTIPHHIHPTPFVFLERLMGIKYNP